MQITWLGASCFKFQHQNLTLLTDPFSDATLGVKMPRLKADLVLLSNAEHPCCNNVQRISGARLVLEGPGEVETDGVFIYGISINHGRQTIYMIETNEFSIVHLGIISKPLTDHILERIEGTDVLLIPVGGDPALNATEAATVIAQVEPRITIPMFYKTKGGKGEMAPIDAFAKEMGITSVDGVDKLRLQKKDLPEDKSQILILQPNAA